MGRALHGASLRSAREEIARDHVARTPMPRHGLQAVTNAVLPRRVTPTFLCILIIVSLRDKRNPFPMQPKIHDIRLRGNLHRVSPGHRRWSRSHAYFVLNLNRSGEEFLPKRHTTCDRNHNSLCVLQGMIPCVGSMAYKTRGRFLCRIPLEFAQATVYFCGRCTWTRTYKPDDAVAAKAAFNQHRCEDFPRRLIDQERK